MKIKSLTRTSILASIVFVSMYLLNFTLFGSALHAGSLVIVVISLAFPRREAVIASALGATLFDLSGTFASYAPYTFIARLSLSYIVSLSKDKKIYFQFASAIVGSLVVCLVYFVSYLILIGGFEKSVIATIPDFLQLILAVVGVIVAQAVKRALTNYNN